MMTELYEALRAIDVPEDHARRCAQAISPDRLATKADLTETERTLRGEMQAATAELRREIKAVETNLRSEIKAVETKLDNKIDASVARLENKIDRIAASVEKLSRQMNGTNWFMATIAAWAGIQLIRLFVGN